MNQYTPEQITELLEEIQTAREAATPGPWRIFEGRIFGYSATSIDPSVHEFDTGSYRDAGNARLIANAPTWLQQLTEIVQQLQTQKDEAWKAYDNLKAEMEALGAELEQKDFELSVLSKGTEDTLNRASQFEYNLEIAIEALEGYALVGLEGAKKALDRIKTSQVCSVCGDKKKLPRTGSAMYWPERFPDEMVDCSHCSKASQEGGNTLA
ncbi:hypothetical protein [Paenibacillus ehimensis]|uniref:Uncharacterized protein n=1 Tax=Paenibacillus ehimensis TaxID=79264 RepID=A0ABT8VMN2_9BACL|nr:hypothetical protein [Paenibacillus ehimensis]MDO3682235.1 hypothetical protein [Paenibacillus ehimensis]